MNGKQKRGKTAAASRRKKKRDDYNDDQAKLLLLRLQLPTNRLRQLQKTFALPDKIQGGEEEKNGDPRCASSKSLLLLLTGGVPDIIARLKGNSLHAQG